MDSPHEKLAESLEVLRALQKRGVVAVRSDDLTRTHRERLVKNGFLQEVMKGWYIPIRPDEVTGESSAWYASFWGFCAAYLKKRFGTNWSLSPEQSLLLHVGNRKVPRQLLVRSPKARNKITKLPHDTSLFDTRATLPEAGQVSEKDGLRLFSVPSGLVNCGNRFFLQNATDARAALALVRNASDVLALLLEGGHTTVAGRLAGAFRNIGRNRIANDIVKTMQTADYDIREKDPFENTINLILPVREQSPYVNRIRLIWQQMREPIFKQFPAGPGRPSDIAAYLKAVDDIYVKDAYHSLSIEGYRVSPELIERVRSGEWNPDESEDDRKHHNTLAARGYWQAYQAVRESIRKVLEGENPGAVSDDDHGDWYREMFGPCVTASLLRTADLAGYRNDQVYIHRSMYVPPRYEAVRDCMPAFFDLLREEPEPSVRVVLGHFMFVYIHPYMDGNGRIGRFLMNVMLAGGGYPWAVVPLEKRGDYMDALERGSVEQDIVPFAVFLGNLVSERLEVKQAPQTPTI
ncbi:MAG: cell filamentation protein Fic [Desulfobacterales bacterium CG07_land_8_20_14_0_80_52_14]|nr:MAG: cell filamentation protein Fic [Desulfobacterales bacterium CG07_land_8_20_14_0_80_52_14]